MKKLLIPAFAALLFPAALMAADRGLEVFQDKCSACHDHKKAAEIRTDRKGWEELVARMKKRAAGAISNEDAAIIVDYLSKTFPSEK